MTGETGVLLDARNLRVTFHAFRGTGRVSVYAVRGVSFSVARGETLGIVGESGSGKSVTVQALPGLLPANAEISGEVIYDGADLRKLPPEGLRAYRGKKIGVVYQEPGRSYDPLQNMESVFLETLRSGEPGISRKDAAEKAARLLEEAGLDNARGRLSNFPHQFSGGQLQRISIALALAQDCELLIADEPTTALDVTIQRQIIDLLKTLQKERGISVIFISHDIDLVADISDRIMVMYGGLVMESGAAEKMRASPLHPYTRALLAASPRFGSHHSRERLLSIPGKVPENTGPGENGEGAFPCPFAPRCGEARDECGKSVPLRAARRAAARRDAARHAAVPHEVRCVNVEAE